MRFPAVLATVVGAVFVQALLVRYAAGGRLAFDFTLVGVVFVALRWDARAGLVGGSIGGVLQDVLSGGVAGVGGLAKTLVGGAAGGIGSRFVITRPHDRALLVAGATVVHRLIMVALTSLIDQQWSGLPLVDMLEETVVNTACAWALFRAADGWPAVFERRRLRRQARWVRRNW